MPLTQEQLTSLEGKTIDWRRVPYVEASDTLDALRGPEALVVDTRVAGQFEGGHYPGAVHARERDQLLALPRERALYLYCT